MSKARRVQVGWQLVPLLQRGAKADRGEDKSQDLVELKVEVNECVSYLAVGLESLSISVSSAQGISKYGWKRRGSLQQVSLQDY